MAERYCITRTLCLLGMVAGVLLCLMGQHRTTWLVMDTESSGVFPQNSTVVSAGMSPRYYWAQLCSGKMESHDFALEKLAGTEWLESVRTNVSWCVFGALFSVLVLCLSCHRFFLFVAGLMGFVAAGAGAIAVTMFHLNTDTLTESLLGFPLTSYGWAFYAFCAGVGFVGFTSLAACFPIGQSASTYLAVRCRQASTKRSQCFLRSLSDPGCTEAIRCQ